MKKNQITSGGGFFLTHTVCYTKFGMQLKRSNPRCHPSPKTHTQVGPEQDPSFSYSQICTGDHVFGRMSVGLSVSMSG